MNKKRVADNNRQNEYMQCATLGGVLCETQWAGLIAHRV